MRTFFLIFIFITFTTKIFALDCPDDSYIVNEFPRSAYYRDDGTYVSATSVSSYCRNYRNNGPIEINFEDKIPIEWPHKKETFRKCTENEKNKFKKTLSSIDKKLTNVGKVRLMCAKESATSKENPATSMARRNIIVIYDEISKHDFKRVMVHEFAHFLYDSLSETEKKKYWDSSGWVKINPLNEPITLRDSFTEEDGTLGANEDFANNVEHYFFGSKKLKNKYADIHAWMEKFFGDKK